MYDQSIYSSQEPTCITQMLGSPCSDSHFVKIWANLAKICNSFSAPPKSGSYGMTRKTYRLDCRRAARQSGQAHGALRMACEARHGEVYEFIYLSENSVLSKIRCISLTPVADMKRNSCKIWAPQNIGRDAHACARLSMTEGKNARKVSDVQSRQYCRAERAGFAQQRTAQGRSVTML